MVIDNFMFCERVSLLLFFKDKLSNVSLLDDLLHGFMGTFLNYTNFWNLEYTYGYGYLFLEFQGQKIVIIKNVALLDLESHFLFCPGSQIIVVLYYGVKGSFVTSSVIGVGARILESGSELLGSKHSQY